VPDNVPDMARDALRLVDVLGLRQIDLLGFSLGGFVAQELVLVRRRLAPRRHRRQGAPRLHRMSDDVYALATQDVLDPERFIKLFFSGSAESRAKAVEFLGRITARKVDRDEPTNIATRDAQLEAITRGESPTRRSSRS
jgi:pimeloyl-ACP methyl ester carboxylesterase